MIRRLRKDMHDEEEGISLLTLPQSVNRLEKCDKFTKCHWVVIVPFN